jgi:hypothetical protein
MQLVPAWSSGVMTLTSDLDNFSSLEKLSSTPSNEITVITFTVGTIQSSYSKQSS